MRFEVIVLAITLQFSKMTKIDVMCHFLTLSETSKRIAFWGKNVGLQECVLMDTLYVFYDNFHQIKFLIRITDNKIA